jgi:hypothetical protein
MLAITLEQLDCNIAPTFTTTHGDPAERESVKLSKFFLLAIQGADFSDASNITAKCGLSIL